MIDSGGYALDFAMRCQAAGHEVKWYLTPRKAKPSKVGDGLATKVASWERWMSWADLVFLPDNARFLEELEPYRRRGLPIFAPNVAGTRLELDRATGQHVLRSHGIKALPYKCFQDFAPAEAFVRERPQRYVLKPFGDADRTLTYCARSAADMLYMLRRWHANGALRGPFMLQDFVPGIEMAVGGWFGPRGWHCNWVENWEFKKLMNGELGVATGEQGTVLRYTPESKLARLMLEPLTDYLEQIGYVGYIDQNCIIDESGQAWPLEFTCRPGWPLFNIQQAVHTGDPAAWMLDLLEGRDTLRAKRDVAVGVVVSIPDYPYDILPVEEISGIPIYAMPDASHVHLFHAMGSVAPRFEGGKFVDQPCIATAGNNVMTVTGTGGSVEEAMAAAYRAVSTVEMANSPMYRTDVGARLESQLPKLQQAGYALGVSFRGAEARTQRRKGLAQVALRS
jgi:phosphoribosylamine--glycine ligase